MNIKREKRNHSMRRAQATASEISVSDKPNSASLAYLVVYPVRLLGKRDVLVQIDKFVEDDSVFTVTIT